MEYVHPKKADCANVDKKTAKFQYEDQHQQPFWNEFDMNSALTDRTKTEFHDFFFVEVNTPRNEKPLSSD